jgi:hypothetical protein
MTVLMSYHWRTSRLLSGSGLIAAVLCISPAAQATEKVVDTLQMHGFLSQAWIASEGNDFFGPSSENGGSFEYTEIGANASLRPHRDVLLAAQLLWRQAGDTSEEGPVLDYGIIDYQMISNRHRTLGIQAGRVKNPFGFYNQTRDIAFTRPSILLPQSIYFDRTRSLGLAGDGVSAYLEERLSTGTLYVQTSFGEAQIDEDVQETLLLPKSAGDLDSGTSALGQMRYEHDGGKLIAAVSTGRAQAQFNSNANTPGDGEFQFQPTVFSLQYNDEYWSLTGEYAIRKVALTGFTDPRNHETTGESWYLQYTRRFHNDWQWLIRYDYLANNRDDQDGSDYEASGFGQAHTQYAKDITLGLQWSLHPQVLLAAEYHSVDGTGWLPHQGNTSQEEIDRYWNMFLLQMSLRF